jgi:hypothetical protein
VSRMLPPSNRLATGTARPKERPSEHKIKDESNEVGYEESSHHPDPSRHLTPFCVPIDISEGKEKCRGEDQTLSQTKALLASHW